MLAFQILIEVYIKPSPSNKNSGYKKNKHACVCSYFVCDKGAVHAVTNVEELAAVALCHFLIIPGKHQFTLMKSCNLLIHIVWANWHLKPGWANSKNPEVVNKSSHALAHAASGLASEPTPNQQ